MTHYYRRPSRLAKRVLVSDYIRGVTVEFYTQPGVFSYKRVDEGTKLLLEHLVLPREDATVLDVGCGYGVIGITIAKAHPRTRVYMVDVNPVAVELARLNAKHNGVADRVTVLLGSVYEPVNGMRFDLIASNPPLSAGMDVVEEIVRGAPSHLSNGGSLQMVLRKGEERVRRLLADLFPEVTILARKKGYTVVAAWKR